MFCEHVTWHTGYSLYCLLPGLRALFIPLSFAVLAALPIDYHLLLCHLYFQKVWELVCTALQYICRITVVIGMSIESSRDSRYPASNSLRTKCQRS